MGVWVSHMQTYIMETIWRNILTISKTQHLRSSRVGQINALGRNSVHIYKTNISILHMYGIKESQKSQMHCMLTVVLKS